MSDFNSPNKSLPDLMPLEDNRPSEVSPEELDAIKFRLMETAWRTKQIVKVLERHNTLLERDIEKITNLKRRLRRSIGIIPGMSGRAGALLGVGVGMGIIPPIGGFKNIPIPPIGKPPKPPLIPEPDPIYVPVDEPVRVPVETPVEIPVETPVETPVGEPVGEPVGDPVGEPVPNPGGIINWPEIPLIPGLYPKGEDLGQGLGQDIFNPNALPTPSFTFSEGMNFNWDTFLETPSDDFSWIDALTTAQIWEILKANLKNPVVWTILAIAGLSAAALLVPADAQILSALGAGTVLMKLKAAIIGGKLIVPAAIKKSALMLLAKKKAATITALSLTSAYNFSPGYAEGLNLDSSFYNSETFKLNTRKTDTFVIITDNPID